MEEITSQSPIDRYHIKCEFAQGGMGVIYDVFEKNLRRNLAMKVLLPESIDEKDFKRSHDYFLEEALITAQLEHPNIVPVHDMGELSKDKPYFTMKKVKGEPLSHIIKELQQGNKEYFHKYPLVQRLIIIRKVCDALAFAHSRNIIHRDIKPDNIMIGDYGEVLLMDWGVAKYRDMDNFDEMPQVYSLRSEEDFSKTKNDRILGTPLYISPEQLSRDPSSVDQQSDIYLLGGTLYHLITFSPPHQGKTLSDILECSIKGKIVSAQKINPSEQIPTELEQIIKKALALKKEDRYLQVEDLCMDLDAFIAGAITSEPVSFKKDKCIIRQGEEASKAFFILKGKVDVRQRRGNKEFHIATVEAGSVVGEMAIISSQKRMASVIAAEDLEVLVIDRQKMEEALQKLPPWMEKIILNLTDRLQTTTKNSHPLMLGDSLYHIFHQLTYCLLSMTFESKFAAIEEILLNQEEITKQISGTLCIDINKVEPVIEYLSASDVCEKIDKNTFKIKDFVLFSHMVNFLHKTKKIEVSFPLQKLTKASGEVKNLAQEICEDLLTNVSFDNKESRYTLGRRIRDIFGI